MKIFLFEMNNVVLISPFDMVSLSPVTAWNDERRCIGEGRDGRSIKLGVGHIIVREQDLVTAPPPRPADLARLSQPSRNSVHFLFHFTF